MSPNLLLPPLAALYSIVSIASITHDGSESYIMAKGVIAKVQKSKTNTNFEETLLQLKGENNAWLKMQCDLQLTHQKKTPLNHKEVLEHYRDFSRRNPLHRSYKIQFLRQPKGIR